MADAKCPKCSGPRDAKALYCSFCGAVYDKVASAVPTSSVAGKPSPLSFAPEQRPRPAHSQPPADVWQGGAGRGTPASSLPDLLSKLVVIVALLAAAFWAYQTFQSKPQQATSGEPLRSRDAATSEVQREIEALPSTGPPPQSPVSGKDCSTLENDRGAYETCLQEVALSRIQGQSQ
jgi:hypothetical protein